MTSFAIKSVSCETCVFCIDVDFKLRNISDDDHKRCAVWTELLGLKSLNEFYLRAIKREMERLRRAEPRFAAAVEEALGRRKKK